jgi:ATP sulfurylase
MSKNMPYSLVIKKFYRKHRRPLSLQEVYKREAKQKTKKSKKTPNTKHPNRNQPTNPKQDYITARPLF